jgi:hypothetical protein
VKFLALILSFSAVGFAADVDLAKALEKAAKGELRDRVLMAKLEKSFSTSHDAARRIQIANVLTYAPASSGLRDRYVDFILGQSQSESVLGKSELFRVHRLRAERLYEAGKFAEAAQDFNFIFNSSDPLVREYAILKSGWCQMNIDKPHLAWELWMESAEKTVQGRQQVAPNLAHSLGQALIENKNRTADDFERLGKLKLDAAAFDSLLKGIEQGIDIIDTPAKMAPVVEMSHALKWSATLADRVLEKMGGTGSRACLFVPWVTQYYEKNVSPTALQVAESCALWLEAQTKELKKAKPRRETELVVASAQGLLTSWVSKQDWKPNELRLPFTVYMANGEVARACETGLTWLSRPMPLENRMRAPVPAVVEQCKAALAKDGGLASRWMHYFQPDSTTTRLLSESKDPLLFVALSLLSENSFQTLLVKSVSENPKVYEATLLPVLILEQLEEKKQLDAALTLWSALVQNQADDPAASGVWKRLLRRQVSQLNEKKASPEALRELLTRALLAPADPNLSEFGYGLWLEYLAEEVALVRKNPLEAESKLAGNSAAKATAEGLLSPQRVLKFSKLAPASVETMAWFGMYDAVWKTLTSPGAIAYSKVRSESLEVRLLSAMVEGRIDLATSANSLDPSLRFLSELGKRLKEAPSDKWLDGIAPLGGGPVSRDTSYLQAIAQKQKKLLTPRKGPKAAAQQALDWIQYLDRQKRDLARRTWSHQLFFERAEDSLSQFCQQATEKVPDLRKNVQGAGSSAEQWNEFFSAFEKKLSSCRSRESRSASL